MVDTTAAVITDAARILTNGDYDDFRPLMAWAAGVQVYRDIPTLSGFLSCSNDVAILRKDTCGGTLDHLDSGRRRFWQANGQGIRIENGRDDVVISLRYPELAALLRQVVNRSPRLVTEASRLTSRYWGAKPGSENQTRIGAAGAQLAGQIWQACRPATPAGGLFDLAQLAN